MNKTIGIFLVFCVFGVYWLFLFPETQTKTMLVYLWNLISKITILRTNWQLLDQFVKSKVYLWNVATQYCNIIVFSVIIVLKTDFLGFFTQEYCFYDALVVNTIFAGTFAFFLILLNFLKTCLEFSAGWGQFKNSTAFTENFLWAEECFLRKFLEKSPFLSEQDLFLLTDTEFSPRFCFNNNFVVQEKIAFNSLDDRQKEVLLKISQEGLDWFTEMVFLKKKIDMVTFNYSGRETITIEGACLVLQNDLL